MTQIPEFEDVWRRMEGLVDSSSDGTDTQTLSNGDWYCWAITISNKAGAKIQTQLDTSLYIGSVAAANQLPGGAIDASQWQVIGPWPDWGATDNISTVWRVYVRNISAGASKDVLLRIRARAIANTRTVGTS